MLSRITSENSALSHASQGWQGGFSRGAALARAESSEIHMVTSERCSHADIDGASFDISSLSPPCKDNWSGGARSCNRAEPFWAAHQWSRLAIQTRTHLRSGVFCNHTYQQRIAFHQCGSERERTVRCIHGAPVKCIRSSSNKSDLSRTEPLQTPIQQQQPSSRSTQHVLITVHR